MQLRRGPLRALREVTWTLPSWEPAHSFTEKCQAYSPKGPKWCAAQVRGGASAVGRWPAQAPPPPPPPPPLGAPRGGGGPGPAPPTRSCPPFPPFPPPNPPPPP